MRVAAESTARAAGSYAVAGAWGLAEAVAFFIVPDMYLTRVALFDPRRALIGCAWATLGAALGGALLWSLAARGHAAALLHGFTWIPGVTNDLIVTVGRAVHEEGAMALFPGAFTGQPYKLFAVHAGAQGIDFGRFLLVTLAARPARFVATTLLATLIGRTLTTRSAAFRSRAHLLFWVIFYIAYFRVML